MISLFSVSPDSRRHISWFGGLAVAVGLMTSGSTLAATATRSSFGVLSDGSPVELVTLKNARGVSARVMTYGATLQGLIVPDRKGKAADIVIGYDNLKDYVEKPEFTGVTAGRYANRIAGGRFSLDGKDYVLAANSNGNHLHGGNKGFDKRNWTLGTISQSKTEASVTFNLISPDGEEGYPGTVNAAVTYSLNEAGDLTIRYRATTDKPTVINLTNHSLFNLGGVLSGRSAMEAALKLESDRFTPVDDTLIPTGEIRPVKGTPLDFTRFAVINSRVRDARDPQILIGGGIDHNFILHGGVTARPRLAVTLTDALSGRAMKILTTEPAVQVYTGNFLGGRRVGKGSQLMRQGDAVAFETDHYPDSPNHPAFPTTRLNPGDTYTQTTVHHFYTLP